MSRCRRLLPLSMGAAVLAAAAAGALAWWPAGHWSIARAAAAALPADAPEFLRKAGETLAFYSDDPDLWTEKDLPVRLRASQAAEHFLDLEALKGRKLPPTRPEYAALCRELGVEPDKVGALPYALQEWHDRLVLAFAEHRRWPGDERVKAKVLYLAGVLGHYAADAAQPLHATVHFDGRANADGSSPRTGIHFRMDALPERVGLTVEELARDLKVEAAADPLETAAKAIEESGRLVDAVYRLEARLPAVSGPKVAAPEAEVRDLALSRCRAGARLTATLWYSAWTASAKVRLPAWHQAAPEAEARQPAPGAP